MFTTLLESTPHKRAGGSTAIVSTLFHSALIVAAVYATASTDAAKVVATAASRVTTIQWVKPAGPPAAPAKPVSKPKPKARPVVAPAKVPNATPPIDANAQPTTEPETGAVSNLAPGGAPGAYNAFEVDIEVVAIAGSIRPQYPEMLRSSGTEGQVIAQFIVNEKGRVDKESFKLVSSTHPMFTESVKRALPQMRFKPAKIGGKPVSQLVQQLFVFKLDDR
jgi:protein TonB